MMTWAPAHMASVLVQKKGQLLGSSLSVSPRIFFVCRFPSMVRTDQFCSNLLVIGEDEIESVFAAVTGKHSIDVIIYGIQNHLQDKLLQLFHSDSRLRRVFLFHECFFNATSIDLTIGPCTSLRRYRSLIHQISRCKSFEFAQAGRKRAVTKGTYFIALGATLNTEDFEVYSPCIEYSETWLCSSKVLTA